MFSQLITAITLIILAILFKVSNMIIFDTFIIMLSIASALLSVYIDKRNNK
ncbi:MAG: hypothetical protein IJE05_03075 [Clostridia bacterium]|nr:hypothetical protein [Clostridia bacterium]